LFRTPLNTISLSIRLLFENLTTVKKLCDDSQDGTPSEKISSLLEECLELIGDLDENSSVAVATLNDLINYDKIETKTFSIEKNDVNLWSVIGKTVSPMTLQAKEKNIELKLVTQVSHPLDFPLSENPDLNLKCLRVVGDSIKLAQVIRNLVSNALKFTPRDGKVTISASFEPLEDPSAHQSLIPLPSSRSHVAPSEEVGHVVITVTDSGPGLTEEQLLTLFQEGVQFNANQLQAGQGSGLGLWISKEIVNLHHGHIRATSAGLGCGATFVVKLPVVLRDSSEVTQLSQSVRFHEGVTTRTNQSRTQLLSLNSGTVPTHVLVVDDAASNRKILCRLLKTKGFICHEAENGQECVDKVLAGDHPYEFILLDYEMPVLDGPSAARRLREEKCDLLIIGVTGNVLPEDKAHFIRQGANVVLEKPLNMKELSENLKKYSRSKA
jgi:signal transduction histidine kinase/ActR/RegA family two-component response regulator